VRAAFDADLGIVNFDDIDDGLQIGFPEMLSTRGHGTP